MFLEACVVFFLMYVMFFYIFVVFSRCSCGGFYVCMVCFLDVYMVFSLHLYVVFSFSQACSLDPLLDDSVMFAKKLKRRNKHVQLDIIDGLPHGFLNFSPISTECKAASMRCVRHIMQVLYGFQGEELFDSEDDH